MKSVAFAAIAASTLFASPALAAAPGDWTGFYVGVHAGYGAAKSKAEGSLSGAWTTNESITLQNHVGSFIDDRLSPDGFIYGAQIGANYQLSSNIVIGAEADFTKLGLDQSSVRGPAAVPSIPSLSYTAANGVDAKHMYSLRGKLGYATGNTLLYVHGGYAWVKADYAAALSSNGGYAKAGGERDTSGGFIVGAGVEHKITPNIGVRAEYSYTDQGSRTFANGYLPGSTFTNPVYGETYRQDLKLHLFRVGVNFHF